MKGVVAATTPFCIIMTPHYWADISVKDIYKQTQAALNERQNGVIGVEKFMFSKDDMF